MYRISSVPEARRARAARSARGRAARGDVIGQCCVAPDPPLQGPRPGVLKYAAEAKAVEVAKQGVLEERARQG
eukprot:10470733-Lingulodinium_polyedra.AAC.1